MLPFFRVERNPQCDDRAASTRSQHAARASFNHPHATRGRCAIVTGCLIPGNRSMTAGPLTRMFSIESGVIRERSATDAEKPRCRLGRGLARPRFTSFRISRAIRISRAMCCVGESMHFHTERGTGMGGEMPQRLELCRRCVQSPGPGEARGLHKMRRERRLGDVYAVALSRGLRQIGRTGNRTRAASSAVAVDASAPSSETVRSMPVCPMTRRTKAAGLR